MKNIKIIFSLLILFISGTIAAQNKEIIEDAAYYFDNKDFKKSYELYNTLYGQNPKNAEYQFRLGFCSLFYPEKKARAIELFEEIKKVDKSSDVDYYLAKAYHINYRFDDAIQYYEAFINAKGTKIKNEDKDLVEDAILGLANSRNGKELMAKKVVADIKNIGSPINTEETEAVPIISADESVMIYTYVGKKSTGGLLDDNLKEDKANGNYHEDIFISNSTSDSTWSNPIGIHSLNTSGNDAAIALSPDGHTLFTFLSDVRNPGDIYISNLEGTQWSEPAKLNKNINSEYWEGSCSITSDGRFLYFASERPGGLGGRDLYVSMNLDGDWGPAINLGPSINTKYNEDAPFIHPDGITLFFSSQGHKSIGGYDIMFSILKENNWIEPISMGIPLNTTEDDRYYVINAKGDVGYFSSNRGGVGGKGEQDIYMVTPGILGDKPILALLKGIVFVNDKVSEAKIEVIKKETNTEIGPYYANSKTGKYLMAISPGSGYKIKITVNGIDPVEEVIDVEKLQKFVEIKKDFYLYTAGFESKKTQISVKSILDSLINPVVNADSFKNDANKVSIPIREESVKTTSVVPCNGSVIPDFSPIKGKSLNDENIYKQFLSIAGSVCADGLVFKVQIAAYRKPDNYEYNHLQEFGKPEIVNYPDGISRFTQMSFSNIKDAEEARRKIIAKGQKDAWITAFIDGKRFTLEELILVNFNSKSIN